MERRFPSSMNTRIMGTYIWDGDDWRTGSRKIGQQEAYAKCKALIDPEIKDQRFLWHNKGFIVLELIEDFIKHENARKDPEPNYDYRKHIKPGMHAVYLADGNYYLCIYQMEAIR